MSKNPSLNLSQEQMTELQRLMKEDRAARLAHVEALTQYDSSLLLRAKTKEDKRLAQKAKIEYYTSLGISRQQSWQLDRTSRGLCRICGKPEDEKGGLCKDHRQGRWKGYKGKKLVGQ